jgi:hypothetical protein
MNDKIDECNAKVSAIEHSNTRFVIVACSIIVGMLIVFCASWIISLLSSTKVYPACTCKELHSVCQCQMVEDVCKCEKVRDNP